MANSRTWSPTLNTVLLVLGVGVLIIVGAALWVNPKGGTKIIARSGEQSVEFNFPKNELNLTEVLDELLAREPGSDTDARVVESVLASHNYYRFPSDHVATAIRRLEESEETGAFARSIRTILYDLAGPFSRPDTFADAPDDRVLLALRDLDEHQPSSPLLVKLWEMSLDLGGLFRLREIKISIQEDDRLKDGTAATCVGSLLLDRAGLISTDMNRGRFIQVRVDEPRPCTPATSEALLSGQKTLLWISPTDMKKLLALATRSVTLDGVIIPMPRNLNNSA